MNKTLIVESNNKIGADPFQQPNFEAQNNRLQSKRKQAAAPHLKSGQMAQLIQSQGNMNASNTQMVEDSKHGFADDRSNRSKTSKRTKRSQRSKSSNISGSRKYKSKVNQFYKSGQRK